MRDVKRIYNDCGRIPDPGVPALAGPVRMNAAQSFKKSTFFNTSGFMPEEIRKILLFQSQEPISTGL
jgi:hypothetical protein